MGSVDGYWAPRFRRTVPSSLLSGYVANMMGSWSLMGFSMLCGSIWNWGHKKQKRQIINISTCPFMALSYSIAPYIIHRPSQTIMVTIKALEMICNRLGHFLAGISPSKLFSTAFIHRLPPRPGRRYLVSFLMAAIRNFISHQTNWRVEFLSPNSKWGRRWNHQKSINN